MYWKHAYWTHATTFRWGCVINQTRPTGCGMKNKNPCCLTAADRVQNGSSGRSVGQRRQASDLLLLSVFIESKGKSFIIRFSIITHARPCARFRIINHTTPTPHKECVCVFICLNVLNHSSWQNVIKSWLQTESKGSKTDL